MSEKDLKEGFSTAQTIEEGDEAAERRWGRDLDKARKRVQAKRRKPTPPKFKPGGCDCNDDDDGCGNSCNCAGSDCSCAE